MTETDIPPSPPKPAPQPKPAPPRPAPQPAPRPAPAPMPSRGLSDPPAAEFLAMPFRPENAMTTVLVMAVLLLVFFGVFGVVAVTIWGDYGSTPTLVYITGAVLLALKVLLGILSSEMARRQVVSEVRHTKEQVTEAATKAEVKAEETAVKVAAVVEQNRKEFKADLTEVKDKVAELTNGQLTEVIKEVAAQTRAAERDQLTDDPRCLEKFEELARKVAEETAAAIVGRWRNGDPDRRKGQG